jgi:hypothetical protein
MRNIVEDPSKSRLIRAPGARASTSGSAPPAGATTPYIPGAVVTMSDADLARIVRAGPPALSNPPTQAEYEGIAQHREAVSEQLARVRPNNDALRDPVRGMVQQQTGTPAKRPDQVTRGPVPIRPLAVQTDDELQAIAAKAQASLSQNPALAEYESMAAGKAARSELFKRATHPVTATRVR